MTPAPRASRPRMPGYGLAPESAGLLPWSWAVERLARSRNYWLATVREDGAPHCMPVWGVWQGDAFWFNTGTESRKTRNLDGCADCVVTTESADEPVVVEGSAARCAAGPGLEPFFAAYEAKYATDLRSWPHPTFRVAPRVVFGFVEAAEAFASAATRWTFPSPEAGAP